MEQLLQQAIAGQDLKQIRSTYRDQEEAIIIEDFLPAAILDRCLQSVETLRPAINRNYIPGHKKGGSISRFTLDSQAPVFAELYRSPALWQWLEAITGESLLDCPADDPHTYALYTYTEAGDHIGWHYDTSYYAGKRFTLLLGLIDDSSSRLEMELYRATPARESQLISLALKPGTLVLFNGDRLWHRVTALGEHEQRIALTCEYVTDRGMHPWRRFVSNMKDAIAYFGFRQVFGNKVPGPES